MLHVHFKESDQETIDLAKTIKQYFSASEEMHISYWKAFLQYLIQIMAFGTDEVSKKIWGNWPILISAMLDRFDEEGILDVSNIRSQSNIFNGMFDIYPKAAAFTANPNQEIAKKYRSLCMLALQMIIMSKGTEKQKGFLVALRMSGEQGAALYYAIEKFPEYNDNLGCYRKSLREKVDEIKVEENAKKEKPHDRLNPFLNKITKMTSPVMVPPNVDEVKNTIGFTDKILGSLNEDQKGHIEAIPIIVDSETREYENAHIWQENDDNHDDANNRPTELVEAEAKMSRYWLRRHQNLSENDRACLTKVEKQRLAEFIEGGLSSESNILVATYLVIGAAYMLPITIDEALERFDSANLSEISIEGEYLRSVFNVNDGYASSNSDLKDSAEVISEIRLVPDVVILNKFKQLKKSGNMSFFKALQVSRKDVSSLVDNELKKLRNSGQFKINKKRIDYALTAEVTFAERNPIVTNYIVGNKDTSPPMIAYYGALFPGMVDEVYCEAVNRLMWRR